MSEVLANVASQVAFYRANARCTIVQSAVLRLHVICLSVCNVGGSGAHRLEILKTNQCWDVTL